MSNFELAQSWSVAYLGVPDDDARKIDGLVVPLIYRQEKSIVSFTA